MRHYDTINRIQDDGTLLGEEVAAYNKLDGQNICIKYSPKTKKFDQFGSRKRVFDYSVRSKARFFFPIWRFFCLCLHVIMMQSARW